MKKVFIGKEGSGKTLLMGQESERILYRNVHLHKKTGFMRPIVSNIAYSAQFLAKARKLGVPVKAWRDIEELQNLTECDLFIDEVGAYFDARTFSDLPLATRLWLAQAQKLGVHIYAGAQDWAQIDVSFRRLVSSLYEVKKIAGSRRPSLSLPGSKFPWAIILIWRIAPASTSESAELRTLSVLPEFFFVGRKKVSRFDTNARIAETAAPPLKRIQRHWTNPQTGKVEYTQTRYV